MDIWPKRIIMEKKVHSLIAGLLVSSEEIICRLIRIPILPSQIQDLAKLIFGL